MLVTLNHPYKDMYGGIGPNLYIRRSPTGKFIIQSKPRKASKKQQEMRKKFIEKHKGNLWRSYVHPPKCYRREREEEGQAEAERRKGSSQPISLSAYQPQNTRHKLPTKNQTLTMFLKLYRTEIGPTAVTGKLYVDNVAFCDTLEPAPANSNVALRYGAPGCIAPGFYPVRLTMSPRFGEVLPLIDHVIGRSGIRIHPGNTARDTTGCVLVGTLEAERQRGGEAERQRGGEAERQRGGEAERQRGGKAERLLSSKNAFMHLRARMQRAVKNKEEIWIEIVDATDLARNQDLYYDQATHTLYEGMPDSTLRVVIPQEVMELMRLQGNWDPIPAWEDRVI